MHGHSLKHLLILYFPKHQNYHGHIPTFDGMIGRQMKSSLDTMDLDIWYVPLSPYGIVHSRLLWFSLRLIPFFPPSFFFPLQYPMTTSLTDSNKVLLRQIRVVEDFDTLSSSSTALRSSPPGTAMFSPSIESLIVKCKEGYLDIKSLQSIGKRQMTAAQWIIGYRHYSDPQGFLFFQ